MNRTMKTTKSSAAESPADKIPGSASREKPARRAPSYGTAAGALLLTLVLFLCVMLASCVPTSNGEIGTLRVPDPEGGDDYILSKVELENAYFQSGATHPSLSYWMKRGDKIAVKWDAFEFDWQREGKTCDFVDNSSGTDCQVCDYCQAHQIYGGLPCLGINSPVLGPGSLKVIANLGFRPTEITAKVFEFEQAGAYVGSCSNNTTWPVPTIEPETSGLFQISSDVGVTAKGPAEGKVKIHLLFDGFKPPVTSYQMVEHIEVVQPPRAFYKWEVTGDQFWDDNFSPTLRVTKVRVLKGKPSMDVNTGRFKLDETTVTVLRPSSIILAPAFNDTQSALSGTNTRCFADPASEDGDIDLRSCRTVFQTNCPNCSVTATPTYLPANQEQKLTWFAEFNPCQGCGLCTPGTCATGAKPFTLADGEILAIVFTVEIA